MWGKILFIDAYDSFTNNIIALLEKDLCSEVVQIKIDSEIEDFPAFLKPFSAVVAGPGPGNPANIRDVGLIRQLWDLPDQHIIPILGICLGFQSLVLAFGGKVERLPHPKHGIESAVICKRDSIFRKSERVNSVQYHSLHASLGHDTVNEDIWNVHPTCPYLQPLAWEFECQSCFDTPNGEDEKNPHCILMGVKHVSKPFHGIQFHPESICSHQNARQIVTEWGSLVQEWHAKRICEDPTIATQILARLNDTTSISVPNEWQRRHPKKDFDLEDVLLTQKRLCQSSLSLPSTRVEMSWLPSPPITPGLLCSSLPLEADPPIKRPALVSAEVELEGLNVPNICQILGFGQGELIVFDSEMRQMPEVGGHSIIGILEPEITTIHYTVGSQRVERKCNGRSTIDYLGNNGGTIFLYLKNFMQRHRIESDHQASPFWGGLMGIITYEACLESIEVQATPSPHGRPDIMFAFVERSIVIDHLRSKVYIQSIKPGDENSWLPGIRELLKAKSVGWTPEYGQRDDTSEQTGPHELILPSEVSYKAKIRKCQEQIRAGNSYELCLTAQLVAKGTSTGGDELWPLYLRLRSINPAPFSAFVHLGPLTLLSTSPERFLSWSRPRLTTENETVSTCQFRPIKGTVQKYQMATCGKTRTVGVVEATRILSTKKERAENLMIVDLIRHDLHGVVGAGNVTVTELMAVEEYDSVFQLVSVIEGNLRNTPNIGREPSIVDDKDCYTAGPKTGIDVLAASLPPGSMTGAPKRRSCEILQDLEGHQPRSAYSGVLGYMCVGGGGDFSVIIRSLFRWDDSDGGGGKYWNIGAGGAVTGLSTEEGEWEEMLGKMQSTMRVFG